MAPCRLKIGITATWSSKLSLNSLNLICEMNETVAIPITISHCIRMFCSTPT